MKRWLCVLTLPKYKVGDPAPTGYLEWHEWARVQHRGGLRQHRCRICGNWEFPQERCRLTQRAASVPVSPPER